MRRRVYFEKISEVISENEFESTDSNMSSQWNIRRSIELKCESITSFLSRMRFLLTRRNKFIEEQHLINSVRNIETVNIIEEIEFAQSAVDVMRAYIRALEEDEKRRQLASKVILFSMSTSYILLINFIYCILHQYNI